ncbi:JAB domain-containing protein [Treponema pectinovorum]|uniref:JAB domain-containing protein n=1 Tax=Treponema pectinovorum TaxID=164 RepID=UPI0011F10F1A|nr:JAB domain-containing protein [Treponema pectinovorum]
MELFKEYTELVDLYDKNPSRPNIKNELINICYLPEFYSRFGLNTENQKLALSSKHLYTMQVSKDVGYYKESSDTHYHNLKKETMLEIPELLLSPDFVFYDSSFNDFKADKLPSSLVVILPQEILVTNKPSKEFKNEVLVAYIEEPINPMDKVTILATSFRRTEIKKYIDRLIKKERFLYINEDYLNEKKSLSTVYPGIQFPNIAIHSNGGTRNSMAFLDSFNKNIRQYRENVNLKRMKVSGLYLENIPENEKTRIVCNKAFANNPYAVNYFPEKLKEQAYKTKVFETLDKKAIQSIPDDLFVPSLQYFMQNTEHCNHQSKIIYNTIIKRLSEKQKDILYQSINHQKEPSEKEIISSLEDWSNGNFYTKLNASPIPQNIQTISDSVISFEQKDKDVLEIIGKQFETDASGKPTLEGMKAISKAMKIYSDKHYETARYLFVKDGTIIRHVSVSSQTPSSTIIKPDENFLFNLKSYAKENKAQIVFLHNHPSGYVEPSDSDIELTEYLNNFFTDINGDSYFSGHVILDHGSYGLYNAKEREWNALINDEILPLSEIEKHFKIELTEYGSKVDFNKNRTISVSSIKELSDLAKKCDAGNVWNTRDWIPAFMLTGNGIVTSLEYINMMEFQNKTNLSEKLKSIGRDYGSENVILLPQYRDQFLMSERFAQETGKIKEVIFEKKDGSFELSKFSNGNIFNDILKNEILVEDSDQNIEKVKEKIIYAQSVNKNTKEENKENKTMSTLAVESEQKTYPWEYMFDKEGNTIFKKGLFHKLTKHEVEQLDESQLELYKKAYNDGLKESPEQEMEESIVLESEDKEDSFELNLTDEDMEESFDLEADDNEKSFELEPETKKTQEKPVEEVLSFENEKAIIELTKQIKSLQDLLIKQSEEIEKLRSENEVFKEQIRAKKDISARDSLSQDSSQSRSPEEPHKNYVNKEGFGRDTAYKTNISVPPFGIYDENTGEHNIIRNAKFAKIIDDEFNPGNATIVLEIMDKNGNSTEFKMPEKEYEQLINNVQELEERKQGKDQTSFDWMKAHMDYALKMGIDDNMYRLNSFANFMHNFKIQCRHNNAHNPEQALKIVGLMYKDMPKEEKKRFLKERENWDKKYGEGSYDKRFIEVFEKEHSKANVAVNKIVSESFSLEKAEKEMNPIYEILKSGEIIENTKTKVGDNISFAMTIQNDFGKPVKLEKNDYKIMAIQKGLHHDKAFLFNETTKAYQTVPLDMLVTHIQKVEKLQAKEEKKRVQKDHNDVGFGR